MLLKSLPYETFLRNVRSGMLPEKLRRKTIVKNRRTEMLLKRLPDETFHRNVCSGMLQEKTVKKNYRQK